MVTENLPFFLSATVFLFEGGCNFCPRPVFCKLNKVVEEKIKRAVILFPGSLRVVPSLLENRPRYSAEICQHQREEQHQRWAEFLFVLRNVELEHPVPCYHRQRVYSPLFINTLSCFAHSGVFCNSMTSFHVMIFLQHSLDLFLGWTTSCSLLFHITNLCSWVPLWSVVFCLCALELVSCFFGTISLVYQEFRAPSSLVLSAALVNIIVHICCCLVQHQYWTEYLGLSWWWVPRCFPVWPLLTVVFSPAVCISFPVILINTCLLHRLWCLLHKGKCKTPSVWLWRTFIQWQQFKSIFLTNVQCFLEDFLHPFWALTKTLSPAACICPTHVP